MEVIYFPVLFYWMWCSLKSGNPFYFVATNPGIKNGGMLNDPKYPVLKCFKGEQIPRTLWVAENTDRHIIEEQRKAMGLDYPLIAKPDIGERGLKVELIKEATSLNQYHKAANFDYLLQEYIALPLEVGIFYYRFPDKESGKISSVVVKEMLQVTGNGRSSLKELIMDYPRARLQSEKLEQKNAEALRSVPREGEVVELETIGNHNRGTTFLDGNRWIGQELLQVIERLARQVPGFYYGRFDIKCENMETLIRGRNFKILELNGAKSEPAHIYQPGFPLMKAYRSIFHHWKIMYRISEINHQNGIRYPGVGPSYRVYKEYRNYLKKVRTA